MSQPPRSARVVALPVRAVRDPLWRVVLGAALRDERQAQERTLQDVADEARISMPYLSEIERGRKEPSSEVLGAAARALGLTLADLLDRSLALLEPAPRAAPARAQAQVSLLAVAC